ncbi:MAG: hypothetical protein J6U56_07685 [Spirochaetia bacterium]|nr:hypothetical protein [Spirochaetia bacterium]
MTREEFIFTIGYDGDNAVVDKKSAKEFGKLGTAELFDRGMVKAAVCSAIFSKDKGEEQLVLDKFNALDRQKVESFAELKKIFGVSG